MYIGIIRAILSEYCVFALSTTCTQKLTSKCKISKETVDSAKSSTLLNGC